MIKQIDTYIINDPNNHAHKKIDNKNYEKDENGKLVSYRKEDVINIVGDLISNKKITLGKKYNVKDSDYVTYNFSYENKKSSGDPVKYVYRVKVSKKYYNENKPYMDSLDKMVSKTHTINLVNKIKMVALGASLALMTTGFVYMAGNVADKEFEAMEKQNIKYMQEMNDERRLQNMPPLGAVYEDGSQFQGTYLDWLKYISGLTDKSGSILEEDNLPIKIY